MCGICGVFNTQGGPADAALLNRMTETLRHRGPDDSGASRRAPWGLLNFMIWRGLCLE